MSEKPTRKRRVLSPESKWEIFLQVTTGEISQADAARKWQVDVSTIIGIRRTAKDAALAAFARKPGRPAKERNWELEAARAEIDQLAQAVMAQAIELVGMSTRISPTVRALPLQVGPDQLSTPKLAVVRGRSGWG